MTQIAGVLVGKLDGVSYKPVKGGKTVAACFQTLFWVSAHHGGLCVSSDVVMIFFVPEDIASTREGHTLTRIERKYSMAKATCTIQPVHALGQFSSRNHHDLPQHLRVYPTREPFMSWFPWITNLLVQSLTSLCTALAPNLSNILGFQHPDISTVQCPPGSKELHSIPFVSRVVF